jgi:hypothetical protein
VHRTVLQFHRKGYRVETDLGTYIDDVALSIDHIKQYIDDCIIVSAGPVRFPFGLASEVDSHGDASPGSKLYHADITIIRQDPV